MQHIVGSDADMDMDAHSTAVAATLGTRRDGHLKLLAHSLSDVRLGTL